MIQLHTLHRLLAAADVSRDPYAVAEAAGSLLAAGVGDETTRIHYARALATLGLGVATRRVLEGAANVPEALQSHFAAVPAGAVAWTSRARRFRANAAVLLKRWPEYADLLNAWDTVASRYELHLAGNGNAYALDTTQPVWKGWLGNLVDHKSEAQTWRFDKNKTPTPLPVAFDGIGYGWLLMQVLSVTANSFLQYGCVLYVVEPDPVALCMAMHIHDLQAVLGSDRVRIFLGPDALGKFKAGVQNNLAWSVPGHVITQPLTAREAQALQEAREELTQERIALREKAREQIDAYYANKDAAFWAG